MQQKFVLLCFRGKKILLSLNSYGNGNFSNVLLFFFHQSEGKKYDFFRVPKNVWFYVVARCNLCRGEPITEFGLFIMLEWIKNSSNCYRKNLNNQTNLMERNRRRRNHLRIHRVMMRMTWPQILPILRIKSSEKSWIRVVQMKKRQRIKVRKKQIYTTIHGGYK